MNWSLLAPLLVTTIVAIVGWLAVHRLSAARDRANKRRELRVRYLIDAYRKLENAGNREASTRDYAGAFESAVADIQLYGSPEQVELARNFALDFAAKGEAALDTLLNSLRSDLRKELQLPPLKESITYLRITDKKNDGYAQVNSLSEHTPAILKQLGAGQKHSDARRARTGARSVYANT